MIQSRAHLLDIENLNISMLIVTTAKIGNSISVPSSTRLRRQILDTSCCLSFAVVAFRRRTRGINISIDSLKTKKLYNTLILTEMPLFVEYLRERLSNRNLDIDVTLRNLESIPSQANSAHRLFILQWLLNGLATTSRVSRFMYFERDDIPNCHLCRNFEDSLEHLQRCDISRAAADHFIRDVNSPYHITRWEPEMAALQIDMHGSELNCVLRMNFALWRARCTIACGANFNGDDDLISHIIKLVNDRYFNRSNLRRRHISPPAPRPPGSILYRSDGANRG